MKAMRVVFAGFLVAVVLVVSQVGFAAAQGSGTIEIHARVCPSDAPGNLFDDCHGNPPSQPFSYSLNGGTSAFVDADGNVSFTGLTAGTYNVSQTEGIPLEFANLRVFCSVQTADPVVVEEVTDGPNFSVALADGEHVVCDVYSIPENLSGLTPTPAATATPGITLPNTGSGLDAGSGLMAPMGFALVALILTAVGFFAIRRPRSQA